MKKFTYDDVINFCKEEIEVREKLLDLEKEIPIPLSDVLIVKDDIKYLRCVIKKFEWLKKHKL